MLQIVYAPLDELVAHERNPKAHDVEGIAGAIRRFGFADPVVIDERTGILAAGHGRLAALSLIRDRVDAGEDGWGVPANVEVDDAGVWRVPQVVGWSSTSDAEAEAALVALNRWTEVGGWDEDQLLAILADLAEGDALEGTGYDTGDLDELRAALDDARHADLSDDDAPPKPDAPAARLGDVWHVGPHRIVCGDATDEAALEAMLEGAGPVGLVWTDPPYGVKYESKRTERKLGPDVARRPIENDDLKLPEMLALLRGAFGPLAARTRPGTPWYVAVPPAQVTTAEGATSHRGARPGPQG